MQTIPLEAPRLNLVRATFEDGMSTFQLSCHATLEELADRLNYLAQLHRGRPVAFDVRLHSPPLADEGVRRSRTGPRGYTRSPDAEAHNRVSVSADAST